MISTAQYGKLYSAPLMGPVIVHTKDGDKVLHSGDNVLHSTVKETKLSPEIQSIVDKCVAESIGSLKSTATQTRHPDHSKDDGGMAEFMLTVTDEVGDTVRRVPSTIPGCPFMDVVDNTVE